MSPPSLEPAAELFEEGWSRVRGRGVGSHHPKGPGAALGRAAQMARAATGGRPAVFKAIRSGGCHSRTELTRQLTYLTTKSSTVFDASGKYDGLSVLSPKQIEEVAERFAASWDPARQTKLGHTSHLLLSFPIGTKPEAVRDVARGVVQQFFQGEGSRFDYIVAVHTDRAHTHAHVVLNRHSPDGEMFYLRSGHHFSYELFREAMVEHGDKHGLRLEATRRLDRGVLTYEARSSEVQQARAARHERPVERQRVGADLEQARRHVALASLTYRGLAGAASHEGFEQVSQALMRASVTLANNGVVLPTKVVEVSDAQGSFDGLLRAFARHVQALEERIATAPSGQRPRLEQGFADALASVAGLNPLGERSALLRQAPSTVGVYTQARIEPEALDRLNEPRVRAAVDAAVQGTGLSAGEVLARVKVGADSAALEEHWQARDVAAVGRQLRDSTAWPEVMERALDRLDEVYTRIDAVLQEVGVLREAWVATEEPSRAQDVAVRTLAPVRAASPPVRQADEPNRPPVVVRDPLLDATAARARDQLASRPVFGAEHAAQVQPFRAALERQLGADELTLLRQGDLAALARITPDRASQQALAKAYLESDSATRDTPEHHRVLREIVSDQMDAQRARYALEEAQEEAEEQAALLASRVALIRATAVRLRNQGPARSAFGDVAQAQAQAFRTALEGQLDAQELARVRQGDDTALVRLAEDRLERLALAKAYLESDPATRDTPVHRRVLREIVGHQVDEHRLAHGHEEDGHTHG